MTLKTLYNDFYGDETRWWVGVVQSINDPATPPQGRVRVRIYGVHSASEDDIPNSALPWAQVLAPITQGGTSGINGTPVGIQPYAQVFGIFLDGKHSQLPLVLGSIPKIDGPNPRIINGRGDPSFYGATGTTGTTDGGGVAPVNPGARDPRGEAGRTNPGVRGADNASAAKAAVGGTAIEQIYNYLESYFRKQLGLGNSKELAAGFAGNFRMESNGIFNIENPGKDAAVGIAQWLGPRYSSLIKFANDNGRTLFDTVIMSNGKAVRKGRRQVPDLITQLEFVLWELLTPGSPIGSLPWREIRNSGTPELAADRIEAHYEIAEFSSSKGYTGAKSGHWRFASYRERQARNRPKLGHYQERITYARIYYNKFAIERTAR